VVIARNAERLIAKYPQLDASNTLGDFSGRLSDRGERIALSRPDDVALPEQDFVVVDTVSYGDGDDWGRWIDGDGSSLELIDPRADNRRAMNWAGSDETDKAPWTTADYVGSIDHGKSSPREFRAFLLQGGECLVDDVQVSTEGGSVNFADTFESGQGSWGFWGTHVRSSIDPGAGYGGGQCLHIRASGKGDNGTDPGWQVEPFWNRTAVPLATVPSAGQIVRIRAKVRWLAGWPHLALALQGFWLEASVRLEVPDTPGTPGLPNSSVRANAGPAISDVRHVPPLPAAGEAVSVTCGATDPDGPASLTLVYRLDPSATVTRVPMLDDGTGADAVAGDGFFSAGIPGQSSGQLVGFSVEAVDGLSAMNRFPGPPPTGAPERECLVRFGHSLPTGAFQSYHLWLTAANIDRWQNICGGQVSRYSNEPIDLTLVYDGSHVDYLAGGRYRGLWRGSSRYQSSTPNPEAFGAYSISQFGTERLLGGREIKLDQPGQNGGDRSLQKENYCFWMAKQVDIPSSHIHYVDVNVNGGKRGIKHDLQTPALDFCRSWFNDSAPLSFKDVGWTDDPFATYRDAFGRYQQSHYRWNLRKRRPAPPDDDFTPVYALAAAFDTQDPADYARRVDAVLNARGWLSYFALNGVVTGWDSYGYSWCHNMYAYLPRHRGAYMFIYDMDHSLAGNTGSGFFPTDSGRWPVAVRFCNHPAFRRVYWRFLKEVADGPLVAEKTNAHFDNWYQAFLDNGVAPNSPTGFKTWIANRRATLISQLDGVRAPFEITTNSGNDFDSAAPIVSLTGTAPVEIERFLLNGVEHRMEFPTVTGWTLATGLVPGPNVLTIQGVDTSGNVAASDTITVTFTGSAVSPAGCLVINEITYHPASSLAEFVEIHNLSPTETFDLGGMRLDGFGYTFPPGSLIGPTGYLVVAENLTAYQVDYGNAEAVAGVSDGSLDNGGETLRLLMPAGSNAWTVIDEVRYDDDAPWPRDADGRGPSLQLIDPRRDNNRIGNWAVAPMTTQPQWRYAVVTGQTEADGVNAAVLHLYLGDAGAVLIDDVRLVQGTDPRTGTNLLLNGDFEAPLAGTWTPSDNHAGSGITNAPVHDGVGSLHLVATGPGNSGRFANSVNQGNLGLSASTTYSVGLWYYPTTEDGELTIELTTSDILDTSDTRFVPATLPTSTPGAPNNVAAELPVFPPLWINEVMPSNASHSADNHGEFEPWIELYNAGTGTIDLGGHYLSDDGEEPAKWAIPPGATIDPGERLVVWADGETGQTAPGFLHAGFRLNSLSGCVVLAREHLGDTVVLDAVAYDRVGENFSYGSYPDGDPASRLVFHYPTPGLPNSRTSQVTTVVINEWMADNDTAFVDPADDDCEDWFELYNYGAATANLGGYRLTDTPGNTAKYVIPGGTVLGGRDYLLVWADEEAGQTAPGGDLHVNFKLARGGESIGLYAPDGTLVDEVVFGPQTTDTSEGRWPDDAGRAYRMAPPTPGSANQVLLITALTEGQPDQVTVSWDAEPGAVYRLERRDELRTGTWAPLGTVTAQTTSVAITDTNAVPGGQRFYRLAREE